MRSAAKRAYGFFHVSQSDCSQIAAELPADISSGYRQQSLPANYNSRINRRICHYFNKYVGLFGCQYLSRTSGSPKSTSFFSRAGRNTLPRAFAHKLRAADRTRCRGSVRIYLIPFLQVIITPISEPTNKKGATLTKTNSNT